MNYSVSIAFAFAFAIAISLTASTFASAAEPKICAALYKSVANGTSVQKIKKFTDVQWDFAMKTYPEFATNVGFPGQDDKWDDYSIAFYESDKATDLCLRKALAKISRAGLKGEDVINYDLLKDQIDRSIERAQFPDFYMPLDHLSGVHMNIADTMADMPRGTKKNWLDRIARLEKVEKMIDDVEARMREGLKLKVTPVKMFLEKVPAQFDRILPDKPEDSSIYLPFKTIDTEMTDAEKTAIQKRALEVVTSTVYPRLKKMREFLVKDYIPNARTFTAWKDMPNGQAWYADKVKARTTTNKTPDELHQLGLSEVARIRTAMDKVRDEVKFKGDFKAFNKFLLTDKQFQYKTKEDLLIAYRDAAKRIDPELIRLFGTLPRQPYGIREMPDYKAKEAPAAYYESGSLEAGRPGYFTANTYNLPSRMKWAVEDLTLHEAVPGHHLQLSISQELKDLPMFRRYGFYTAYTEGWGLYAETLGYELGLLKDPYSRYGQLAAEMWRAVRLVVDTGMHAKGWSRDQAITYMLDNTAMDKHEVEVEIDRYLSWPGQALAYKVGQLKFRELRELAQVKLGAKFDVRKFHDEVLKHGALPLDVLEKAVKDWIAVSNGAGNGNRNGH